MVPQRVAQRVPLSTMLIALPPTRYYTNVSYAYKEDKRQTGSQKGALRVAKQNK